MRNLLTALMGILTLLFVYSCQKENSLEFSSPAKGSLQGDGSECLPKKVAGTYTPGKVLNDSNFIEVSLVVAAPGSYTIATNSVNGYSFKATGVFMKAGPATVQLKGSGTPVVAGVDIFTVEFDTTECAVAVTVGGTGGGGGGGNNPSTSGEYFPMTNNSWWSYDDGAGSDSLKITSSGTATISGKTYQRFIRTDDSGPLDTAYFRKDNATGFYYETISTEQFSWLADFTQPRIELLFLKKTLNANDTWNNDYAVTISGMPATLRLKLTCANANTTLTVNGKSFTNVIHVKMAVQVGMMGVFTDIDTQSFYYAKDIGRIRYYDILMDEQDIRNWKVN